MSELRREKFKKWIPGFTRKSDLPSRCSRRSSSQPRNKLECPPVPTTNLPHTSLLGVPDRGKARDSSTAVAALIEQMPQTPTKSGGNAGNAADEFPVTVSTNLSNAPVPPRISGADKSGVLPTSANQQRQSFPPVGSESLNPDGGRSDQTPAMENTIGTLLANDKYEAVISLISPTIKIPEFTLCGAKLPMTPNCPHSSVKPSGRSEFRLGPGRSHPP